MIFFHCSLCSLPTPSFAALLYRQGTSLAVKDNPLDPLLEVLSRFVDEVVEGLRDRIRHCRCCFSTMLRSISCKKTRNVKNIY